MKKSDINADEIELSMWIEALRNEILKAETEVLRRAKAGEAVQLLFQLDRIELDVEVRTECTREGKGEAGIQALGFKVITGSLTAKNAHSSTQRIKLVLKSAGDVVLGG